MLILSHRGFWNQPQEKNTLAAFQRSFSSGFGVELDVRDYCGKLVVSHDIPGGSCLGFSDFLGLYKEQGNGLPLAINIKADGLQLELFRLLNAFGIQNYFVFDMSVPDALGYLKNKMNLFTRQSEFEAIPLLYNQADGVWMDEFHGHWIKARTVSDHLAKGKKVCIVSPELHRREHLPAWCDYKALANSVSAEKLLLCTDFPEQAKEFFND